VGGGFFYVRGGSFAGQLISDDYLRDCNILIEINILNGLDQVEPFLKRTLEGFAANDHAHTAGAFIGNGGEDGICEIGCAMAFAAAVDEAYAAAIAIQHLIAREVDRVIIRMCQFCINKR